MSKSPAHYDGWQRFCQQYRATVEAIGLSTTITSNEGRFRGLLELGATTVGGITCQLADLSDEQWAALERFAPHYFEEFVSYAPPSLFPAFYQEVARRGTGFVFPASRVRRLLRRGITGFDASASVDIGSFKQAAYEACREINAQCLEVIEGNQVTPNFHQAVCRRSEVLSVVLCNRTLPVVAFAEHPVEMGRLRPIDDRAFAEVFRRYGFEVPLAAILEQPVATEDLAELSAAERKQVAYWKPESVANLIFNWWD